MYRAYKLMVAMMAAVLMLGLSSCMQHEVPDRNMGGETNLEFWITENVSNADWSGHDEITGWFGAREYLGKGYRKVTDEDGVDKRPVYYVSYVITPYPDYADGGAFVTDITITDPEVKVYGLTVDSTFEEFDAVFKKLGFERSDGEGAIPSRVAEKNGIFFKLVKPVGEETDAVPSFRIYAEITNREGIVY